MNFASILDFIKNAPAAYKAYKVKRVVNTYANAVLHHSKDVLPIIVNCYATLAEDAVDKTYENPEPILKLVEAVEGVVKHYGPSLTGIVKQHVAAAQAAAESEEMKTRLAVLEDALEGLTR